MIGYYEMTSICDEIIILSACGTAAIVNMDMSGYVSGVVPPTTPFILDRHSEEREAEKVTVTSTTKDLKFRERKNSGIFLNFLFFWWCGVGGWE